MTPVDPSRRQGASRESRRQGRLFTTKFSVVVRNLAHQLLDHLLPDDAILLAGQFCDRDRVDHFICFIGIDFV